MTDRATAWSITINNPTDADRQRIELLKVNKWFREWKAQDEIGEDGTLHIQAFLRTEQIRFSSIKKALPRAHIEVARNIPALANYVHKDDETAAGNREHVKADTENLLEEALLVYVIDELNKFMYGEEETMKVLTEEFPTNKQLLKEFHRMDPLFVLDQVAAGLIAYKGARIEMLVSNPLVRCAYKKFFWAIIIRNARRKETVLQGEGTKDAEKGTGT